MRRVLPLLTFVVALAGCTGESDAGDVASKPTKTPVKSADQLPENMPPEARASAASAMAQAQAQQQAANDPGRVRAMQEMKKQRGGG